MNFLEGFVKLVEKTEIPEEFALWSAISSVSGAIGRKCFIDQGTFIIYPNFFITLVASSGRFRKTTSIKLTKKFLDLIDPPLNLISERLTPEGLLDSMKEPRFPNGDIGETSHEGIVLADELCMFLNKKYYETLGPLLLSAYDCPDPLRNRTRTHGEEKIPSSFLTMLCGSTVEGLKAAFPQAAVGDGLTSRFIFVYTDTPKDPVPYVRLTPEDKKLRITLQSKLDELAEKKGEFTLSDKAYELHKEKYIQFYNNSNMYDSVLTSGYASRKFIHVMKLSIILAAVENSDLVITERNYSGALNLIEEAEESLNKVLSLITSTDKGVSLKEISSFIKSQKAVSRANLIKQFSHKYDSNEIEAFILTLVRSGEVKSLVELGSKDSILKWIGE